MKPFLTAVVLLGASVAVQSRELYDAQLKFDIDAACVGGEDATYSPDSECHELCQSGACCYVSEEECSSSFDCEVYDSCGPVFSEGTVDFETYDEEDIESACSTELETPPAPGQESLCQVMCQPGECCFLHKDCDESSPEHDSMDNCFKYESCWVLYPEGTVDDDIVYETEDQDRRRGLEGGLRSGL